MAIELELPPLLLMLLLLSSLQLTAGVFYKSKVVSRKHPAVNVLPLLSRGIFIELIKVICSNHRVDKTGKAL